MLSRRNNSGQRKAKRSTRRPRPNYRQGYGTAEDSFVPQRQAVKFQRIGSFDIVGVPDEFRCSLRYYDLNQFSAAVTGVQKWGINSLFKPDQTNTGHKPSFFSQYALLFLQYMVMACEIECTFTNSGSEAVMCTLAASDVDKSTQGTDANREMKYSRTCIVAGAGSVNSKTLRMKVGIPELTGESFKSLLGDPSNYANVGASPTDLVFAWARYASLDSSTSQVVSMNFTLTFACIFKSPNVTGTN